MRRTRPLILLIIVLIVAAVGATWLGQKNLQQQQAPQAPKTLPQGISATASNWQWSQTQGGRPIIEVTAKDFRQVKEPAVFELEGVQLKIFDKEAKSFHLVRSAKATFDQQQKVLQSQGEVEMTMAVPVDGARKGRLVQIRSSGVTFDSAGRATTSQPASFTFDEGDGHSVGASYDPEKRELLMHNAVELNWRGRGPKSKPMKIQAAGLVYRERDAGIVLSAPSKLTRDTLTLDSDGAVVILQHGAIDHVEAENAHGTDRDPKRQIDYAASHLLMHFGEDNTVDKINGDRGTKLVATSDTGRTTSESERIDLEFDTSTGESVLRKAVAAGHANVESTPVARAGGQNQESRLLRAETVQLSMREGGKEIEKVETQSHGTLEFVPNRPGQRHRLMEADQILMNYGAANRIQSLQAVNVSTRTDPDPRKPLPKQGTLPPALTWSKGLSAEFDPNTGEMRHLEQWDDFRYEEGDRKARARQASLESPSQVMTLKGSARVWDATGSADADQIVLDQKSGDFRAEGNVSSTRRPDRKGASSAMLSQDEPVRATAKKMSSTGGGLQVVYEGNAVAWQGANRLAADRIQIDREEERLIASGHVVSQFVDQPKKDVKGQPIQQSAPVFTVVKAAEMVYTDEERLAHYKGGALMTRPGMDVKAREIRAFLKDQNSDSSLDKAFADGGVSILQQAQGRKRQGSAEHAEYETAGQKIILHGGEPVFVDDTGSTRGEKLTYWANNDRLLVNGAEARPAASRILRK